MMFASRPLNTDARPALAGRLTLAVALAALLLLSQGLGLLHRVEHTPPRAVAAVAALTAMKALPALTAADGAFVTRAQHPGHDLFATHEAGDADCRLLDQLAHADVLLVAALPLPVGLPGEAAAVHAQSEAGRRHEARYLARAPPAA